MDPFSIAALINGGAGILSSLFSKKPPQQQPIQNFQQQIPQYQAPAPYVNAQPANLYDVGNSQLYQGMQGQLGQINAGGSALPQAYTQAVMNQAAQNYGLINDRLKRSNLEQANLHGILNSGGAQEMNARQDESYLREMGNVTSNLTQQDFQQRQQLQSMLAGLEGQRSQTSQNAYSLGLQNSGQQNQYNLGSAQQQNQYNLQGNQQAMGMQQNQYNAAMAQNSQQNAQQQGIFGNLAQGADMYALYNHFNQQKPQAAAPYQAPAPQMWNSNQTAQGRAYNAFGFAGQQ